MRQVWAYLVTWGARSDEAAYARYANLLDIVMPTHGGRLLADGTWAQEGWKINAPFSQRLAVEARERGQQYAPTLVQDRDTDGWNAFLDSPRLWQGAVDRLLALLETRFDAPWDGVVFNFERTTGDRRDQLTDWLSMLAAAVRRTGLLVFIVVHGRTEATDNWYDSAYAYDHEALSKVVDRLIYGLSGYWLPLPRSLAPYWYLIESLHYVIDICQIPASKLIGNLGGSSRLMPPSGGAGTLMSYAAALELIGDVPIEWIEENENGTLRQNRAVLDDGSTVWSNDGRWVRARLPLLDKRGITDISLFNPVMAAPSTWQAIANWKQPTPDPTHQTSRSVAQRLHGIGGIFSSQ